MVHPTEPVRRNNTAPKQPNNRKQALEKSVGRLGKWLHFFTGLVTLGLILEYAPDIIEAFRTRQIPSRLLIGGVLITVGVAGELFVGFFASRKDTALREENDSLVARANERAALAEQAAAEANLARVKIEERLADRILSDSQLASIVEKVKQFAGQEYDANTYWDSREPLNLAERISVALNEAGWKLVHVRGQTMLPEKRGVLVYFHLESEDRTKTAAGALVSALNAESVVAELRRRDSATQPKNNKVQIDVGTKPQ